MLKYYGSSVLVVVWVGGSGAMEIREPLRTTQLDPKFKFEVAQMPGGESIKYCFQCGKCTATCPIRRFEPAYKPTHIVRATLLGLRETVLTSNIIWLCASCYSCTERCPQGVRLTDVMRAIRNLAVKEGHVHPFYRMQGSAIATLGRIFKEDEFINEMRAGMGLLPIPSVNREEISTILRDIEVNKILTIEKEGE